MRTRATRPTIHSRPRSRNAKKDPPARPAGRLAEPNRLFPVTHSAGHSLVDPRGTGIPAHDPAVRPLRQFSVGSAQLIRILRLPRRKFAQDAVLLYHCGCVSAPFVGPSELLAD